MDPTIVAAAVAFAVSYVVGALPVAWLVVRRRHRIDMRQRGVGGTSALNAVAVGGVRTALLAGLLEVLKGAAVGLAARIYSPTGWFIATAIAGCVAGDAFPVGFRRSGRGILPLVSGLAVALPTAGLVTALTAIPAAVFTSMRGRIYDAVVTIAIPAGLLLGTREWQSLAPAAVIVGILLSRAALQRRRREASLIRGPAWRMVIDADVPNAEPTPKTGSSIQNPQPWDS
ncbi:MAG TPA: glycerol-3-phosphate acyltransferase [Candidatus Acidoferrales bacterium]|jgi:glycerol-3-phosphate acyltransferase PlsY|nr:glycerol-3-phosphate acyltransferase [Candidatus Acidoferrales bacterium]